VRGRSDRLRRAAVLPDLATVVEKSLPAAQAYSWTAFFLPKGAPAAIVQKLHDAIVQAMDTPAVCDQLQSLGVGHRRAGPQVAGLSLRFRHERYA
jgi:tripartite-type tricarboxylate transporter receptor subunit TctC